MSKVVMLPTAAKEPVVQPKRRGGNPKKIVPLRRGRVIRSDRERRAVLASRKEVDEVREMLAGAELRALAYRQRLAEMGARP